MIYKEGMCLMPDDGTVKIDFIIIFPIYHDLGPFSEVKYKKH